MSKKQVNNPYYHPTSRTKRYQLPAFTRVTIVAILGAMIGLAAFYLLSKLGF